MTWTLMNTWSVVMDYLIGGSLNINDSQLSNILILATTILSILNWFILSVASYLSSTNTPVLKYDTLWELIISREIHLKLKDIILKKNYIISSLHFIYFLIPVSFVLWIIFIKYLPDYLIIIDFFSVFLFIYTARNIIILIKLNNEADKRIFNYNLPKEYAWDRFELISSKKKE